MRKFGHFPEDVDTVINRIIDQLESSKGPERIDDLLVDNRRYFDESFLPDVAFSKVNSGEIDGKPPRRASWNAMVISALEHMAGMNDRIIDNQHLKPLCIRSGKRDLPDWNYIESADISVLRCKANTALNFLNNASSQTGCRIFLSIRWKNVPNALFPGESGVITLTGRKKP